MLDKEQALWSLCEQKKQPAGTSCPKVTTSLAMYQGAVRGHADALAELPPETSWQIEIVDARPERVASALAFFASNEAEVREKLKRGFILYEPFAYSLFLELCSIVAFSFAFGHRRKSAPVAVSMVPVEPTVPAAVAEVVVVAPQPPPEPPKAAPAPRKSRSKGRRGPERNAAVADFVSAYKSKHGRLPSGPELREQFPRIARSTLYWYRSDSNVGTSVLSLRVQG
jgi:hypothetical protein